MPRLFDRPTHRYTYACLMSACMSLIMTISINLIDHGLTASALHSIMWHWPFAFAINFAAVLVVSPAMRALTILVWTKR
jgi:hypothetical protein